LVILAKLREQVVGLVLDGKLREHADRLGRAESRAERTEVESVGRPLRRGRSRKRARRRADRGSFDGARGRRRDRVRSRCRRLWGGRGRSRRSCGRIRRRYGGDLRGRRCGWRTRRFRRIGRRRCRGSGVRHLCNGRSGWRRGNCGSAHGFRRHRGGGRDLRGRRPIPAAGRSQRTERDDQSEPHDPIVPSSLVRGSRYFSC